MDYEPGTGVQFDPGSLSKMLEACKDASVTMSRVLGSLEASGRSAQEWAGDAVSHDVASHYILQLWSGANCTYSALNNYHEQLLSTIEELQRTLAGYNSYDSAAAESLEQL
jgi:hypothetical protein